MIQLLDYEKLFTHFDMGEFDSDSASWVKEILTDDLEFFHEKQAILCLDEFQFARTIHNGEEQSNDKLRVIWELLDSGQINYIPGHGTYYLLRADACMTRLTQAMHAGIKLEKGKVVEGVKDFIALFDSFYFADRERNNKAMNAEYFL